MVIQLRHINCDNSAITPKFEVGAFKFTSVPSFSSNFNNNPSLCIDIMVGNKKPAKGGEKEKANAKGSSSKETKESGGKLKPATAINTRHILVWNSLRR